ncbi:hypothetical protein GWC77_21355 [Paraburkholderia sp. NMBU_R16]|uniref:hypothetical protein n=1 Tax=Paraburkholderia sp. NMBU_R16 TaxID=2698676 RepID=UPI0015663E08|nr:hypothetical protein [Paraburkholderia sp. NMBU_R16]NRO98474.1 hypothetical protein [Paraburkholderia sp. NMBU_R16]
MNTDNYVRYGQYVYVRRYDSAGSQFYLYCSQPPTARSAVALKATNTPAHTTWRIRSTESGVDPKEGNVVANRDTIYLSLGENSTSVASLCVGQVVTLGQSSGQEVLVALDGVPCALTIMVPNVSPAPNALEYEMWTELHYGNVIWGSVVLGTHNPDAGALAAC